MINKATLLGNLGAEPEVRTLENGTAVASMSLATSRSYKDKGGEWQTITTWHRVIVWRDAAERVRQFPKGATVYVEGAIEYRKYDKDGIERTATEIVADVVRRVDRSDKSAAGTDAAPAAPTTPTPAAKPAAKLPVDSGDDLPF